ncbi:putative leucine-rich repeat domain, L domain-containing protein [Medicago truncatula]|uniref:Putative leucine-rich repeat domain, L domain-containing protein n=3 Tax=Medicago truncatula TaxID=3880 RepID=A0A396GI23_MEDTR|nr:putative leucine-rich repeat domain, L domain-containing protein [Medicago truncatula]
MHDLIQEMGREIVREESIKNPGERSRLWNAGEICDVLTNNNGTSAVESICLYMDQTICINLSSNAFTKMPNLRLLAFEGHNYVHLPGGLDFLPNNLRSFGWSAYPLNSLPSNFSPWNLVELSLPYSNLEKLWNGAQNLPSLERIDLGKSTRLIECPNFSNAPNLKHINLEKCESMSHVDPSIFNLPNLEELDVSGCKSLKSLYNSTRSQSFKRLFAYKCYNLQEFISMPQNTNDPSTTTTGLTSSTLHIRNFEVVFSVHISESLLDLPENFANYIVLSHPKMNKQHTLTTLHKVLPSPCFRYVRRLIFNACHNLSEIPDSISLLSSLEFLRLFACPVISLPESINCLPRLKFLEVGYCEMLQSIPSLPQSIQWFYVWDCESLQNVLNSTNEQTKKHQNKCTVLLPNCLELDQHSFVSVLKDAIVRIELGAKPILPEDVLENNEEASSDDDNDDVDDVDDRYIYDNLIEGKIFYMLPAGNFKIGDWSPYHSTQNCVTIDLPRSDNLGIIFYLVLYQAQPYRIEDGGSFGCECYLETTSGECISIKSFFVDERVLAHSRTSFNMMSDHLFLWYDTQCCEQVMEAIKEIKANAMSAIHNSKLTFKFLARTEKNMETAIKECGFRWIYSSEGQVVEEEGCESETNKETHTVDGSESDEQEETVPAAMNFQQSVYGTPNLEAVETKDLRGVLEELLHIGFGGELMS